MEERKYIFFSSILILTFVSGVCLFFQETAVLGEEYLEKKGKSLDTSSYYVGPRECRICHPRNFQMWHVEEHADAFGSLGRMDDNPYCLKCHTTGFNEKGGYIDTRATPQMKGVQCEACHGPGSEHVKAPKDKKSLTIKSHLDYENTCKKCHDKDWDPEFDYKVYRVKIEHWIKEKIPEYNPRSN